MALPSIALDPCKETGLDRKYIQQIIVFAAIFLAFQVGFDLIQGITVTPGLFLARLITTLMATAIYAALTLWLKKRKERGD